MKNKTEQNQQQHTNERNKTSGLYGVWFAFLEYPVKLIGETPGVYFSKVPRTFRAREARVQTAIHFFLES